MDAPAPHARLTPKPGILPFAIAITVLNVLGHTWLGFEQAWLTPFVAVSAAYASELIIELAINGWRNARFRGSFRNLAVFLLPAHISGLAVGMLLYTNERFLVVAFAASLAIFSKLLFRVRTTAPGPGTTHFLNPSNFGIAATLLIFHDWVGVAQPYQFTENVSGTLDWLLPAIIVCTGSFLNLRATHRMPLLLAWLAAFALQALARSLVSPQSFTMLLEPMTGLAFVLFTFYMITDPSTTPRTVPAQIAFGASTALLYGLLSHAGIVFGLFFSLCIVCIVRGAWLELEAWRARSAAASAAALASPPGNRVAGPHAGAGAG